MRAIAIETPSYPLANANLTQNDSALLRWESGRLAPTAARGGFIGKSFQIVASTEDSSTRIDRSGTHHSPPESNLEDSGLTGPRNPAVEKCLRALRAAEFDQDSLLHSGSVCFPISDNSASLNMGYRNMNEI